MTINEELIMNSKKFNKIVIWGFKRRWHTQRFIFQAYYKTLKNLGVPVIWVEDDKRGVRYIEKNDLIISASGAYGRMVPEKKTFEDYNMPVRDDVYYCLHGENDFFREKLDRNKTLNLYYYSDEARKFERINEAVYYDSESRSLYQPWGTDLLPDNFLKPVFRKNRFIFWVGSIWNDKNNHGNVEEINKFVGLCKKNKLKFIQIRFVPNFINRLFVRLSRIAPAIGGKMQVEVNYLPCRMFKNISYGQLGFSNIKKFNDIFKDCNIYDEDMDVMIKKVLSLKKEEYIEIVKKQQVICRKYTIAENLNNIFKYIK
ncbi:MAG: hypothetical protein PHF21_05255 [Bacilli bacterium]|nr:hypothetical protein [Bacilli bacterium]